MGRHCDRRSQRESDCAVPVYAADSLSAMIKIDNKSESACSSGGKLVSKSIELSFLPFSFRPALYLPQVHRLAFSDQHGLFQTLQVIPKIESAQPVFYTICRRLHFQCSRW